MSYLRDADDSKMFYLDQSAVATHAIWKQVTMQRAKFWVFPQHSTIRFQMTTVPKNPAPR